MIAMLIRRLEHGWTICTAATDPTERDRLEDHWIILFRSYEKAVDAELVAAR